MRERVRVGGEERMARQGQEHDSKAGMTKSASGKGGSAARLA